MKQKKAKEKKRNNKLSKTALLRLSTVFIAFILLAGMLVWQLTQLQVVEASEWQARADGQQLKSTEITPLRGVIYDSEMRPLAENSTIWSLEIYPNVMAQSKLTAEGKAAATGENDAEKAPKIAAQKLAEILGMDEAYLYENFSNADKKYFNMNVQLEKPEADAIKEMVSTYGVRGIGLTEDTKRYYPYGDLAAPVIGFLNNDNDGIEGLEYQYNDVLSGTPGRLITARNATGAIIPFDDNSVTYDALDGNDLVLTINADIQQSVEKNLAAAVEKYSAAERGMAIVMDVNTGAILAMATEPDYDLNDPYFIYDTATRETIEAMPTNTEEEIAAKVEAQGAARIKQWRNKAVADTYEPGSVFKIITAAAALDSGSATMDSTYYCSGKYTVGPEEYGCAQGAVHGLLTLEGALIESCNVSFIQIAQQTGLHTWYNYLNGFGFTEPTGIDLPGEPSLRSMSYLVYSEDQMGPVELASNSFGQTNKYTPLQMITGAAAAVNGGKLVQPHVVDKVIDKNGNVISQTDTQPKRQVVSAETSAELAEMLEALVSDPSGYGKNAYVEGYHVGGKSGTSQKMEIMVQENREVYISSFLAFAPANDPEIAVLFVLDEPQDPEMGNYFGGRLAGRSTGAIISDTVKILGIEPDYAEGELGRTTMATPNLQESDLETAKVTLNQVGLGYKVMGSGTTVLQQYPASGTQIPRGGTVYLYTDDTSENIGTVPSVVGKSALSAIDTLKAQGFNVLTTGAPDDGVGVMVETQSIAEGEQHPYGTVITLSLKDMSNAADI